MVSIYVLIFLEEKEKLKFKVLFLDALKLSKVLKILKVLKK